MEHAKNPSATKRGPGRYHSTGHKRVGVVKAHGAAAGFVRHKNANANMRRAVKAEIGALQYRKQRKALALASRQA